MLSLGDKVTVWRESCPCLNPLGSTGKRPVGPEHSVAVLWPFNLFDFFWAGVTESFTLFCFLDFALRNNRKETGP
jgi:hypothetical protein